MTLGSENRGSTFCSSSRPWLPPAATSFGFIKAMAAALTNPDVRRMQDGGNIEHLTDRAALRSRPDIEEGQFQDISNLSHHGDHAPLRPGVAI